VSVREAMTAPVLLGRTAATARWVSWGALPFGAPLGEALGEAVGLRNTLIVTAFGSCRAVVWAESLRRCLPCVTLARLRGGTG